MKINNCYSVIKFLSIDIFNQNIIIGTSKLNWIQYYFYKNQKQDQIELVE